MKQISFSLSLSGRAIAIASILGAASPVFAQSAEHIALAEPTSLPSNLPRLDVRAETIVALRAGQVSRGEASFVLETAAPTSHRLREAVRAEVLEARRKGELAAPGERHTEESRTARVSAGSQSSDSVRTNA